MGFWEYRNANDKKYWKVRDYLHFTIIVLSICNLKFNVCNEIPVIFHNVWNFDYHFIIKELANEFEG